MLSLRVGASHAARSLAASTTRRSPPYLVPSAWTKHRLHSSSAASTTLSATTSTQRFNVGLGLMGGVFLAGLHSATGSQNEFFDYRFRTNKSPDDLASFYGGEEFMELFCIFPVIGQLMMRNGYFDDDGNVITTGIPGTLRVSMVFSDESNEETGETEWFNKRERFRNICWNWTCWDMVTNFGFRTLEDGSIEVYHFGEYFHGNLPVVSQIMKLVFKVHARWLAWSTEHHLNHYAFSSETEEEEKLEEESRRNMPFFLLKNYAWSDLMAMLFGKEVKKPSFLLVKGDRGEDEGNLLPIQRQEAKLQISQDIATDRLTTKGLLARHATETPDDVKAVLTRPSLSKQGEEETKTNSYLAATQAARLRRLSRAATRRRSRLSSNVDVTGAEEAVVQSEPIQQQEDSAQSSSL